jgi:uracil-DNA glycosylase
VTVRDALPVNPKIESSWKNALGSEFRKPYFAELKRFLLEEKQGGQVVYPPGRLIFNAFNLCPFDRVKAVILGQDPYHGAGQAHGLCFSVPDGVLPPPSLLNIFRELESDLGLPLPESGNLENWAVQGVLLLNSLLTVRAGQAGSHANRGWERFTDAVIETIDREKSGIVFLLWGKYARNKGEIIDPSKHLVLKAPHPSPFSASYGFFGSRHFSKTNAWLERRGMKPIDWKPGGRRFR